MRTVVKVFGLFLTIVLLSACGSNDPYNPFGLNGNNPFGFGSQYCGVPQGVSAQPYDINDIDQSFVITKEDDWISGWGWMSPVVSEATGTLELHVRRIPQTQGQVAIFGVLSVDPTAFFNNFLNGNFSGPQLNNVPMCFSSGQLGNQAPGYMYEYGNQFQLEAWATTPGLPNFGYSGFNQVQSPIPSNGSLYVHFTPWVAGQYSGPFFKNGRMEQGGAIEIRYGGGQTTNNFYQGYNPGWYDPYYQGQSNQSSTWTIMP